MVFVGDGTLFLSTPSARRATGLGRLSGRGWFISIHALREEGDNFTKGTVIITSLFLSTPSARRATYASWCGHISHGFLSTPSARRATADQPNL